MNSASAGIENILNRALICLQAFRSADRARLVGSTGASGRPPAEFAAKLTCQTDVEFVIFQVTQVNLQAFSPHVILPQATVGTPITRLQYLSGLCAVPRDFDAISMC